MRITLCPQVLTSEWLMDRCGGGGCAGSLGGGSFPVDCPNMDLTLCTGWEGTLGAAGLPCTTWSAVSRVVGRSISRWIWIPSPGPMCVMWLKLEGALIILDRRSGFLKGKTVNISSWECRGEHSCKVSTAELLAGVWCMKTLREKTNNYCTALWSFLSTLCSELTGCIFSRDKRALEVW